MSEGAVGLGHFVGVVALLDRVALASRGVFQLGGERLGHGHATAVIGVLHDPAHGERNLARRRDFHRHLIGGATDAAGLYFKTGTHIFERLVDDFERINRVRAFARFIDRGVDDPFRERLLASLHHGGNEARDRWTAVTRVELLLFFVNFPPPRHVVLFPY